MSHHDQPHEHEQKSKAHQPHAEHEQHTKGPSSPTEINPNLSSDIAFWSHEFHIDGKKLHELIRIHGTHVDKLRHALAK